MNEKQQIFEIIDGFKNLTSKIKKGNDEIKDSMKNKDLTIVACKKEYKKLYPLKDAVGVTSADYTA